MVSTVSTTSMATPWPLAVDRVDVWTVWTTVTFTIASNHVNKHLASVVGDRARQFTNLCVECYPFFLYFRSYLICLHESGWQQATSWTAEKAGFDSCQTQYILLFSAAFRPVLGTTEPPVAPVQLVP
jgi:hypothetical protein